MKDENARKAAALLAQEVRKLHMDLDKANASIRFLLGELDKDSDAKERFIELMKADSEESMARNVRAIDDILQLLEG